MKSKMGYTDEPKGELVKIETAFTPNALTRYEQLRNKGKRVAAILHVTC